LLKARVLLKTDAFDAGGGWSDSQIAVALDTSIDTIGRTRRTLVEEGLDAALTRRHSPE
jgi:transposase